MAKRTATQKPATITEAKVVAAAMPLKDDTSNTAKTTPATTPAAVNPPVTSTVAPTVTAAQEAKDEQSGEATRPGEFIMISAPNARRRAGMSFGTEPVKVDVSTLSEDQIIALRDDPLLVIRPLAETDE